MVEVASNYTAALVATIEEPGRLGSVLLVVI